MWLMVVGGAWLLSVMVVLAEHHKRRRRARAIRRLHDYLVRMERW
jgi:hypothetical protein